MSENGLQNGLQNGLRRTLAILPIGTVVALTGLSARQIRYYEEQGLILPVRNTGNRRLYSLDDIDKLEDIKELLRESHSMAEVKRVLRLEEKNTRTSRSRVDPLLEEELATQSRFYNPSTSIFNRPLM